MALSNTGETRNSGLIPAGLMMLLVLATPLVYAQEPFCGDGIFNPDNNEQCDDGNTVDGDGCSSTCQIEIPPPICGDANVDPGEQCDDGNTVDGDRCSSTCQIELRCGDGNLDADEQCDDGNTTDGDGCSGTCTAEPNFPPVASNVLISGTAEVGQVLTGSYDYADAEGDLQGASTFRWLHTDGEVDTPIDGATDRTYTLVAADEGALIMFQFTPVAQSGA